MGFAIEAPFAFVDPGGQPMGEGPLVLRHVAGTLGIDSLQWFPLEFQNLIPSLADGRIDVIASGLFITEERRSAVRFSRPKACLSPALVGRRDAARSARSFLCDTCTLAVIRGSVEQRALHEAGATALLHGEVASEAQRDPTAVRMIMAPDLSTAVAAVKSRDAAALAVSAPSARMIVARDSSLALGDSVPPVLGSARGCAALAFRPADRSLADAVDSVLVEFVGSEAHQSLVEQYGFTEGEILCAAESADGETLTDAC